MAVLSRANKSPLSSWWWTVDRSIILATFLLVALGIVLSMAASPPVAVRLGLPEFFFVQRQVVFLIPVMIGMFGLSFLNPRLLRRVALLVFIASFIILLLVLGFAPEYKGARRWVNILGIAVQPSEFIKPAFIVLAAWLMAEAQVKQVPGRLLSVLIFCAIAVLLVLQPDMGQLILLSAATSALLFLSGIPWILVFGIVLLGAGGITTAYFTVSHFRSRIDRFLDPSSGDTYQVDLALRSVVEGGWLGQGPGEGHVKHILPDSHTDFIFAVAAEEFGIVLCIFIAALFAYIMFRTLKHAFEAEDPFIRLALAGLALLFGGQAAINMGVNLSLLPAKGMTLPLISYGRSSLVSSAITVGFILCLSRYSNMRAASRAPSGHLEPAE